MQEKKKNAPAERDALRLNPEQRLCPQFDSCSIARFPVAKREKMGLRVVDNCVEEHIQ